MFHRSSRTARGAVALAVLSIVSVACSGGSSNSPLGGVGLDTSQPPAAVGAKVGGAEIGETTAVDQAIWMVP